MRTIKQSDTEQLWFRWFWRQIFRYHIGRMIAALLMTVGGGLFGTFTAYLASWFVGKGRGRGMGRSEGGCCFNHVRSISQHKQQAVYN